MGSTTARPQFLKSDRLQPGPGTAANNGAEGVLQEQRSVARKLEMRYACCDALEEPPGLNPPEACLSDGESAGWPRARRCRRVVWTN